VKRLVVVLLLTLTTSASAASTPPPPLTDADYFAFADRVTAAFEPFWNEEKGFYSTGARSIDTIATAAMLTVFSTSAAHGHIGPARNDVRARRLVKSLTASPPFYTRARPPVYARPGHRYYDKMFHSPGWTSNMDGDYVDMDKSIDPKVSEGLQMAFRARDVLQLPAEDAARIADEIHRVAYTHFFRYPQVRLNQINWPAELYAYDAFVTGDTTLMRTDYRKHVHAFTQGFKRPQIRGGTTNVGPSYRFIYQSNTDPQYSRNLDSAEYANMTLHFLYWYDDAVAAGMRRLPGEDIRLLRAWTQRVLYGYWTHAGFMNWDSGWSYERWMKGKAWAYAQQGLIAIATSPTFQLREAEGPYAKYLFDRGLRLYEHLSYQKGAREPFRPSAELFHIGEQGTPASTMFWARMAANSVRAVSAGLGHMPAAEPPPFYGYDADIGRLAVSTRHYSTAILAVNRGKVPYGGNELARLYDGDGDPVGGTGGRPPASFGVMVRRGNRRVLVTQTGRHTDPKRPPLTLTRSPRGRVTHQKHLAKRPDAGPFEHLSVRGSRHAEGVFVTSAYDFRDRSIGAAWTIRNRRAATVRPLVTFPTWGRRVRIQAVTHSGRTLRVRGGQRLPLRKIAFFRLRGENGVYTVRLPSGTRGSTRLFAARRQKANPRGGPTLALALPPLGRGSRHLSVTITPSGSGGLVADPENR
jgi:hypothetical protein